MNIIFVPFHDLKLWQKEGFRTRDAHFFQNLEKRVDVDKILIVNRPTSLAELLIRKKSIRAKGELIYKNNNCYLSKISEKTFCIDILIFDIISVGLLKRMWIPKAYSSKRLSSFYGRSVELLKFTNPVAYTSTPLTMPFFAGKNFSKKIFDAVDNLLKYDIFSLANKKLLRKFYDSALNDWDAFVCNSEDSHKFFKLENTAKISVIANGVEPDEFAINNGITPKDMAGLPSPIIGYGGKMQVMFDKELLLKLSKKFPQASFVLVGQFLNKEYMRDVIGHPNIYYLGDKSYEEYKIYLSNFDICVIPYRVETQHGGDPIKFYEYLAANKPIVSTEIGEIKQFHDDDTVFIVQNHENFINAIEKLLRTFKFKNNINRSIPESVTWEFKTSALLELIK